MDDFLDDECADDLGFPDDSFVEARSNDWVANNDRTQSMTVPDPPTPQAAPVDVPAAEPMPAREIAQRLTKCSGAVYAASVVATTMPGLNDTEVWMHYLDQVAVDANAASDSITRMLTDQITIQFHRLGALHSSSANAKTPEAVVAYNAAAARLTAEMRKCMVTLRELQTISMTSATYKPVPKSQPPTTLPEAKEKLVTEVESNAEKQSLKLKAQDNAKRNSDDNSKEEREAGGGRAVESAKESRAHHTGTRQAPDGDSVTQTMAALNRACHAGW